MISVYPIQIAANRRIERVFSHEMNSSEVEGKLDAKALSGNADGAGQASEAQTI